MTSINKSKVAKDLGISRSTIYYKSKQKKKDEATKIMLEEGLRKHPSYGPKRLARHLRINHKRASIHSSRLISVILLVLTL
jgi:DNA-binding XRE family transcriptional regulator